MDGAESAPTKVGLERPVSAPDVARSSDQVRNRDVPTNIIDLWFVALISVSGITNGNRKVSYRTQGW